MKLFKFAGSSHALLTILVVSAALWGSVSMSEANHVFAWVHSVSEINGSRTVPGASFWGFVSNDSSEDFQGPFDQVRQHQLDPVNLIFFAKDSSDVLAIASSALMSAGWTTSNPCEDPSFPFPPIPSTDLFAYFEGSAQPHIQGLHLYKPVVGCFEKFHIRFFQPMASSSWVIGAVHHECAAFGASGTDTRCPAGDTVIGWEDAEDEVRQDLLSGIVNARGVVVANWRTDLDNEINDSWRNIFGVPTANFGDAEVFELKETIIYSNNFEGPIGAEWSNTATDTTPSGRSFLGQFDRETVALTVAGAPQNTVFRLSIDLFTIRSWDGNDTSFGPDVWEVRVKDGQTLLKTTFSNTGQDGHRQAYPDSYPGGDNPAREGAAEPINSLGYSGLSDAKAHYGDTVYHISLPLFHATGPLVIEFDSKSDTRVSDESWGLDNVVLAVSSDAGTISGTVLADEIPPSPVADATVDVCQNGTCTSDKTAADGVYTVGVLPGQHTVRATPPGGSILQPGASDPVTVLAGETVTVPDIILPKPTPPPAGTSITSRGTGGGGIPIIYWRDILTLTTQGCANGIASYEVTKDGIVLRTGVMIEFPLGSGMYRAVITPLVPDHGYASVEIVINCPAGPPQTVDFDIYIDPSGTVVDQNSNPIAGATITLFRSDGISGPFAQVPDGSGIMSVANRNNPDTTDSDGRFGWDVIAGFYIVRAEAGSCFSPDDPSQNFVETNVLTIPPPVTDLVLVLDCNEPPTADAGSDQTLECTNSDGAVATLVAPAPATQTEILRPSLGQIQGSCSMIPPAQPRQPPSR